MTRVEFYDGATLKATDTTAPYTYAWAITSANNGTHSWTAKAYDAANNSMVSTAVSLTVNITAQLIGPWVQDFGGAGIDCRQAVTVDSSGNIFIAGTFSGSFTFGNTTLTSAGARDIFLSKVSSDGTLQWVKRFGSTGDELVRGIVLDSVGNIFLCGTFTGLGSFDGASTRNAGGFDAFIAKYSSQGVFVWSRTLGGITNDVINGIAYSLQQNLLVTGLFTGTVTFIPTTTFSSYMGAEDTFLAKYSVANGPAIWAKTLPIGTWTQAFPYL